MDASVVICTSCGHESPVESRFCGSCGAPLGESPAEVRKVVTVVFCDLVGSTALGDSTDPEALRELMSRYHAGLRAILERHGGTVEKFVGDAAMAIFGLPHVHEDDALRAVRAALEMRDAVSALGLEVRIGVNTGEVVAGSGETLATGDAVNVAARLEQAAGAGEVLIGAATERLVRGGIRGEAVEPLALKGKREPVPAFRVLELLDDVPAFTRPIDAPFVGREGELDRLQQALESAVERRSPQLVTIAGPPGIGKSRLVRELLRRTEARVVVGRCLPYGEGITYWPLREIVAQVGEPSVTLNGSIDADLAALRIGAAVGSAETTVSPEEIAWGFRKLFEAMAAERPLVVVFDDIHWAEPTMLDLVEYVAAFAQDVALVLLCTARPDLFEERPAWTAPRPNATLLTLEPLAESECEALVERLGDLAQETRRRVVETAEGNPLFVEQLVAMQAESGDGELEVPPTLQALLAARIDRLTEPERAVVERGSVEGRLFHRGAVAELLPEPERPAVGTHLMTLVRKELIRPDRASVPGDDGFRFGHILIRDAAYESIPKRQRATLHERYADWLATKLGDDAPDEIVGYHLEQAFRYGAELGASDPALGARAAGRFAIAARAARARQDIPATLNLLQRAVELVPDGATRPALLTALGEALSSAGESARAQSTLEECVALARAHGDAHAEWHGRVLLARLRWEQEPEGAQELVRREGEAAIAAREEAGDHIVLAEAWHLIALSLGGRGRPREWLRTLDRAVAHAREAGDVGLEIRLVTARAPYFIWGPGRVDEGLRYVDDVLARLGHVPAAREFALHVAGHMKARLGEFDEAFALLHEFRSQLRQRGQEREYAVTASCVWDVCLWAGAWRRGEEALLEGYALLERMGLKAYAAALAIELAEAAYRLGGLDEAERYAAVSEDLGSRDDRQGEVVRRGVRAKVLAARGDLEQAESLARQAVELAAGTDYVDSVAGAWLDLAEILRARGDAEASEAAAEALRLYEEKGNLVGAERARTLAERGAPAPETQ